MFKAGEQVCHKYYPEEYGLGIVKDNDGNGFVLVSWENEFGEQWDEAVAESEDVRKLVAELDAAQESIR